MVGSVVDKLRNLRNFYFLILFIFWRIGSRNVYSALDYSSFLLLQE